MGPSFAEVNRSLDLNRLRQVARGVYENEIVVGGYLYVKEIDYSEFQGYSGYDD
jgi:hypothetical protein